VGQSTQRQDTGRLTKGAKRGDWRNLGGGANVPERAELFPLREFFTLPEGFSSPSEELRNGKAVTAMRPGRFALTRPAARL